jgi:hypothetical protein
MKKTLLVAVANGLILTACASHHSHGMKADPVNPHVSILDGKQIVVNQEPLFFAKGVQNVRINWQLPPDSKYTFPKDGIVVNDAREEIVDCRVEKNGLAFSCLNRHTKPGKYKYTIKVEGSPAVAPLDPIVIND